MNTIHEALDKVLSNGVRLQRNILRRWHNRTGYSVPAFLVGCNRSGTSMLVFQLSRTWQVRLYNEWDPAAFENWRLRDLSVIEGLVKSSHAPITLFKPICDTYRTHVLLSRFPTAKVLFAFRHYDDVVNASLEGRHWDRTVTGWVSTDFAEFSTMPAPEETRQFISSRWTPSLNRASGAALYWAFRNRLFFDLHLDQREDVRAVKYEAVVFEPRKELESLCEFLGIQFHRRMAEGIFSSDVKGNPPPAIDEQIRADCEDLWQRLCDQAGRA